MGRTQFADSEVFINQLMKKVVSDLRLQRLYMDQLFLHKASQVMMMRWTSSRVSRGGASKKPWGASSDAPTPTPLRSKPKCIGDFKACFAHTERSKALGNQKAKQPVIEFLKLTGLPCCTR